MLDKEAEPQGTSLIVSQPLNDVNALFPRLGRRFGISVNEDNDR